MKKFDIIDFLRGYSIFTIILFHTFQDLPFAFPFNEAFSFGGTGVHLFNVMSGFGLYYSHLHRPTSYRNFLLGRGTRIYLPYISVLALYLVAFSFIKSDYIIDWYAVAGHIFLFKMFDNKITESIGYHFWYISTIIQFYLLFHIIVAARKKLSSNLFLTFSLAISISWAILVLTLNKGTFRNWNSCIFQYLWEFALGMILAEHAYQNKKFKSIKTGLALGVGFLGIVIYGSLGLFGGVAGKLFNDIPALLGYSLFAIGIYQLGIKKLNNIFTATGQISFSAYLIHVLWIEITFETLKSTPLFVKSLIVFATTYLSSFLIEAILHKVPKSSKQILRPLQNS